MKPLNRTFTVLITGIALGLLYLVLGISLRSTWPIVVVMMFVLKSVNQTRWRDYLSAPEGLRAGGGGVLWGMFVLYTAVFLVRTLIEYRMVVEFERLPYLGADIVLKNFGFAFGLSTAFIYSRSLSTRGAMWSLVIAVGTNAAMNLVLDRFGFRESNVFGESRFEFLDSRWMPPAVRSNAFFAMACAANVALVINLMRDGVPGLLKRPLVLVALGVSTVIVIVAAVKCQFRNNLFAIVVGVPLACLRWRPGLRLASYGTLALLIVFPSLFMGDFGYSVLQFLAPDRVLKMIGSDVSGAGSMSNRTDLYEFGWEKMADLRVFLIGEGPVLRDAQDAIGGMKIEGYRMPYHSAFIDFLMQFGVLIGLSVVGSLGYLLHLGFKRLTALAQPVTEAHKMVEMGIVYLTVWFALSISDSGMSNFETMWLAVIPLFGALEFTGRGLGRDRPSLRTGPTSANLGAS